MSNIWNMGYCDDESDSIYFLPKGHENPRFYPCKRYIPAEPDGWFDGFKEIVSVDSSLMWSEPGIEPVTREQAMTMEVPEGYQILGVYCLLDENGEFESFDVRAAGEAMEGFTFCGFDLADTWHISAILNCGSLSKGEYFIRAFSREELNEYGLISEFKRARDIQLKLNDEYPDDDHAYCAVFAIWRRV